MVAEVFRLAAQRVERGEIEGKAETSVWIARRMNVIVGGEWDKALDVCAEYFDANAGDDAGSIVKVLNEIADRISPAPVGLVHVVNDERETNTVAAVSPDITPGETVAGDEPDESVTEQGAAEPPKGDGGTGGRLSAPGYAVAQTGADSNENPPKTANPGSGGGGTTQKNCPGGNCSRYPAQNGGGYGNYGWFWW